MSRATEDRENLPFSGHLVDSQSDGLVVIELDERELRLWNHESERLSEAAAASGGAIEYQPRWRLLWVPGEQGRFAFCVAEPDGDRVPCPPQPPEGSQVELLESAGGFSISVDDLGTVRH
jgi:hypothetical protein